MAPTAPPGAQAPALLVCGELASVMSSMRTNIKWSPNHRFGEDELEEPLLEELKALRRKIFSWADWSAVEPLEYLAPFLEVIKSPETSGPITAVALTAVNRFLERDILAHATSGVTEAIRVVADSVTQCKFEATYPASDDCVLYKILDVLVACVRSQWGRLLTDDNLINIFQACYRIGHYQTEKGRDTSELLTEASRHAMVEMVHLIFAQLEHLPDSRAATPLAHNFTPRLQVSPSPTPPTAETPVGVEEGDEGATVTEFSAQRPVEDNEGREEGPGGPSASGAVLAREALPVVEAANGGLEGGPFAEAAASSAPGDAAGEEGGAAEGGAAGEASGPPPPAAVHHEIVSLLPSDAAPSMAVPAGALGTLDGYGIGAMREILQFIVSLVGSSPQGVHQDLPAHGLDLMNVALLAAGRAFEQHESLLGLLQQDLVKAMFSAAKQPSLACLSGVCQVAVALYVHLGRRLLLQLEALIGLLLLPLAEGKGVAVVEQQQAALEGILDFCHQPGFIRDIYINCDCRIERENLFEQICALLSKTAFPINGPLSSVHLQSLDGILAILAALAGECSNLSSPEGAVAGPPADPSEFVDIWTPLCEGQFLPTGLLAGSNGQSSVADMARLEKHLKGRLAAAAEHFNRDQKKGLQYLQSIHLLPHALEPDAVARFLRFCPGLGKASIGEVLGERDLFYEQVRQAFIGTFQFRDMEFDVALRLFMDAFRPPGEGQKIDRIMQVFGKRYHEEMPSERSGLKSADAAYVLAFSVIMLNTDLHNTQNKKKMSPADFARINDNTNDGEPMPRELLTHIYQNISREELRISAECAADELPSVFWTKLLHDSRLPRGMMIVGAQTDEALERDMFSLIWGPTLAAVSVILDNAADPGVVRRALDALLLAARMAAFHQVDEVVDSVVISLSKFAGVLHPGSPKSVAAFGESEKARAAVEAMFLIANRYGDWLRSGWRNVLDAILRLHKLGLLPAAVIAVDGEEVEEARQRLPRPIKHSKSSGGSIFSRAINSLISIEGSDAALAEQAALREAQATQRTQQCVESCRVDEIFADSKFLTGESLVELVKAAMWAAGNVVQAVKTGENTDSAELCLELLVTLALRNRDRVGLIWPLVHEFLAACTSAETAERANPLVERAVLGLLRVCQRLLPYKEDTAEMLLHSLKLVLGLSHGVAWELADRIGGEMLALLKSSAPYVRTEAGWQTVCAIVRLTSLRPDCVALSYESLAVACRNPAALTAASYMPLMETSLQFITRYKQQQAPEMAVRYLDLIEAQAMWLVSQGNQLSAQREGEAAAVPTLSDEQMLDLWLDTVQVLTKLCTDECQPLRDSAIGVLHRTVQASDSLGLPSEIWVQTTRELLIPVVADLTRLGAPKARSHPGAEKSVRLAVNMLVKVLLQYMDAMLPDKDFYALWQAALQALQDCMSVRHEGVLESVPENVKNMLLVLATNGVLRPDWRDVNGQSLWDLTFSRVHTISSGLNPNLLQEAGLFGPPPQPPTSPQAPTSPTAQPAHAAMAAPGQAAVAAPVAAALPPPPTAAAAPEAFHPAQTAAAPVQQVSSMASAGSLVASAADEASRYYPDGTLIPGSAPEPEVAPGAAPAATASTTRPGSELMPDVSAQDLVALRGGAVDAESGPAAAGPSDAAAQQQIGEATAPAAPPPPQQQQAAAEQPPLQAPAAQEGDEYSEEQQAEQAGSGCKQS